MPDVLEVGDVMRLSVELVQALHEHGADVLARVARIERQPDGTVKLLLENADLEQEES